MVSKSKGQDYGPLGEKKSEAVKVAIRCRPLNTKEKNNGNVAVVRTTNRGEIFVAKPQSSEPPKHFTFDYAYGETESQ